MQLLRAGDRPGGGILVLQRTDGLRRVPDSPGPAGADALPVRPGKGGDAVTLLEMSQVYGRSAQALHRRITLLRSQAREGTGPGAADAARRRIADLMPLWREARELSELTAHYYDWRRRHDTHQP